MADLERFLRKTPLSGPLGVNYVGQVMDEEKYDVVTLKFSINSFSISLGIVSYVYLRGSVFGVLYLYLSYSHISSCSNDCLWGSSRNLCCMCVLCCFHSHSSLFLEMVIILFPSLLHMWAFSSIICSVRRLVCMSMLGLHSCRCM
jgi:hypothetical protein